jgi:tetratricopeptide (TPR) repeat protein
LRTCSTRDEPAARASLDRLAGAHLVHIAGAGHYAMHDLVRLYARERRDPDATGRLLRWYRDVTNEADRCLRPAERPNFAATHPAPRTFATADAALAWLDDEAVNLVAAVHDGATAHPREAWQLAAAMYGWLVRRQHRGEWIALYRTALDAAARDGDAAGRALLAGRLAIPYSSIGEHAEAARWCRRAFRWRHDIGDLLGAATALLNLAAVHNDADRPGEAATVLAEAAELSRTLPDARHLQALIHSNLGEAHTTAGRHDEASAAYERALDLAEGHCAPRDIGQIVLGLAAVDRLTGRHRQALERAGAALGHARDAGDLLLEAEAQEEIGRAHLALGAPERGLEHLRAALTVYELKQDRRAPALARLTKR